jgi:hypothetical protein
MSGVYMVFSKTPVLERVKGKVKHYAVKTYGGVNV